MEHVCGKDKSSHGNSVEGQSSLEKKEPRGWFTEDREHRHDGAERTGEFAPEAKVSMAVDRCERMVQIRAAV